MISNPSAMNATGSLLSLIEKLVVIGSPTFKEGKRADFIRDWLLTNAGLEARQDESGSLWVDLSGGADQITLLDAHIDTVFPDDSLELVKEETRWWCPGIVDDTAACAFLMHWLASPERAAKPQPFLVTFTTGEEGLGNLGGIRSIMSQFSNRLRACWHFDSLLNIATWRAPGSKRYRVEWQTGAGHSWRDFGQPSAVQLAAEWIHELGHAFPWEAGQRTFNIGTISGGTSVNVIAGKAEALVEARSPDSSFLEEFHRWMLAQATTGQDLPSFAATLLGERPAGELAEDHPMVLTLQQVYKSLNLPLEFEVIGTNANAPLSLGIPAIATGLVSGGGGHTREEYLELASVEKGWRKFNAILDTCR